MMRQNKNPEKKPVYQVIAETENVIPPKVETLIPEILNKTFNI